MINWLVARVDDLRLWLLRAFGDRALTNPKCIQDYQHASNTTLAWRVTSNLYVNYAADGQDVDGAAATARARLDSPEMALVPRVLRDVSACSARTSYFGVEYDLPVLVAPTALHGLIVGEGEVATARAAEKVGAGYCYNFALSSRRFSDVVAAAPKRGKWLHLYLFKEREIMESAICMAEESKAFSAIVVTADHPHNRVQGNIVPVAAQHVDEFPPLTRTEFMPNIELALGEKPKSMQQKLTMPSLPGTIDPSVTWQDIAWIRSKTSLPIIVKGILTADDARQAARCGAKGIIVSNHGFRQIGGAVSAVCALPHIVKAVGNNVDVFVDSGIRRSSDVVKVMSLGAKGVLIGRPALWALSVDGQHSLANMLEQLKRDIVADLMSLGCSSVRQLGTHCLWGNSKR